MHGGDIMVGKRLVLDIEGNALLVDMLDYTSLPYKLKPNSKMWVVALADIDSGEVYCKNNEEITRQWLQETLKNCETLILHNGIKFDLVVLMLFGLLDYRIGYLGEGDSIFGREVKIVDTLILSRLFAPDRFGGHSLSAWGKRLGNFKIDFRQLCIDNGYITKDAPKGAEFQQYCPEMDEYCIQDTQTTADVYRVLMRELENYSDWGQAIKQENKLADLGIRRETFGFWFDKELALTCLEDLSKKMEDLQNSVNPILPKRKMTKGELNTFTPPKRQLSKDGKLSSYIVKFAKSVGGTLQGETGSYELVYKDQVFPLPFEEPLETEVEATIDNLDHVKMHLISLGWKPSEWRERDLTKDSKKQNISYDKRITALKRWIKETSDGKYKEARLGIMGMDEDEIYLKLSKRLKEDKPVRVPTSPSIRVGVEKDLCPNLISLGDKVGFAKEFALYLTYKHRKSSIAGGDIEEMDFDEDSPNTGFLSMYREVDGRIPTPAIEIGANTNRYRHIGVCNIARATSIYGKEMRSLFGSGNDGLQLGYDYSSLENRIQGHYVFKYNGGEELAKMLVAEKPNDLHSLNAIKFDMNRSDVKSLGYAILYGAQAAKIMKMLGCTLERGEELYEGFWDSVPALKELKKNLENYWEKTGKQYILGIDGRKIFTRSKHSLLNALFQSAGVICVKYATTYIAEMLEKQGYNIDPFKGELDVCEMISYHDEAQYFINRDLIKFKTFETEELAQDFVNNWEGEQLSTISHGNSWYVTLPNPLSIIIKKAIEKTEQVMKLNVNLGYEWVVNKTWYGCH